MTADEASLDDYLVVDAGAHLHETPAGLIPYCDPPWRGSLEMAQRDGRAGGSDLWPRGQDVVEIAATPAAMRAGLSAINVDIAVLFPDSLIELPTVANVEYAAALARAYNAWLVDLWCRPEDGLLGALVACPQAPEDTAAQIEKYAKHPGVAGVYLPGTAVYPLWGHRQYDPIYRAAETAGLPVLLHSAEVVHPVFPFNTHGYASGFARHTTAETFSIMVNIIDMMTRGVPVRFPKLRIALTGAGLSWAPFLGLRLDKVYLEYRRLVPFLSERPSAYLSRFFLGTHPIEEPQDPGDLVTLMSLFDGEDQAVFVSAWPHKDFDHPGLIDRMPFSPEAKQKILGGNALRLFNLDERGTRLALTTAVEAQ
jgi:predicted TIM-barrel fold metal-dependent hydrolase